AAKYCQSFGIETAAIGFGRADLSFLKAISSSDANAVFTNLANLAEAMVSVVPRSQGQNRSSFLRDAKSQEVATWTPQQV
ncbi:MAG: VWA domain-containing protein, partial [Symbiobacteriaceae bacterium]|nr:VWA domain-containing protein [Symbiobacteriaceae bacterium]